MNSTIKKAAAPMTGGMSCPPVEAAASTPPANSLRYPSFFIIGIVKEPDVTTFATELPLMVPCSALEKIATLAGPPTLLPAMATARSLKYCPTPVLTRKAPNSRNRNMNVADTYSGVPRIPSLVKNMVLTISSQSNPL